MMATTTVTSRIRLLLAVMFLVLRPSLAFFGSRDPHRNKYHLALACGFAHQVGQCFSSNFIRRWFGPPCPHIPNRQDRVGTRSLSTRNTNASRPQCTENAKPPDTTVYDAYSSWYDGDRSARDISERDAGSDRATSRVLEPRAARNRRDHESTRGESLRRHGA